MLTCASTPFIAFENGSKPLEPFLSGLESPAKNGLFQLKTGSRSAHERYQVESWQHKLQRTPSGSSALPVGPAAAHPSEAPLTLRLGLTCTSPVPNCWRSRHISVMDSESSGHRADGPMPPKSGLRQTKVRKFSLPSFTSSLLFCTIWDWFWGRVSVQLRTVESTMHV